jgi:uncharacterized protein
MDRKEKLANICKGKSVALAYIFGSQAEVGQKILNGKVVSLKDPLTDLDLGVVFRNILPSPNELPRIYADLYNSLADLFLPLRLDLVFLQEQHSVFQANAVTGICVYAEDKNLQSEYEENIMRRASDFFPFLERHLNEYLGEVLP